MKSTPILIGNKLIWEVKEGVYIQKNALLEGETPQDVITFEKEVQKEFVSSLFAKLQNSR